MSIGPLNGRKKALEALLELTKPIEECIGVLGRYSWDSEEGLVVLESEHLVRIIDRFILGELKSDDVEDWANMVECREDIEFESKRSKEIGEVLFWMANPLLVAPLTHESAVRMKTKLSC